MADPNLFFQSGSCVPIPFHRSSERLTRDLHVRRGGLDLQHQGTERHVIGHPPMYVLGLYYVACSCGQWMSEGLSSLLLVPDQVCAFQRAAVEAKNNLRRFKRALQIAN